MDNQLPAAEPVAAPDDRLRLDRVHRGRTTGWIWRKGRVQTPPFPSKRAALDAMAAGLAAEGL